MAAEGKPSKNNNPEVTKFETKKLVLTEKSESLFNEIEELGDKLYDLKNKLSDEEDNLEIVEKIMELEKKEEELKKLFNDNNQEIQNLNEIILEKKIESVKKEKEESDKNDKSETNEQKETLNELLEQNEQNRKISVEAEMKESTIHKLYDSEDDLPSVADLAENYRKKAEETLNTSLETMKKKMQEYDDNDVETPEIVEEGESDKKESGELDLKTTSEKNENESEEIENPNSKDTPGDDSDVLKDIQVILNEGDEPPTDVEVKSEQVEIKIGEKEPVDPVAVDEEESPKKKPTEKMLTETPKTGTTKTINNSISGVSFADTEFKADEADVAQIRPIAFEETVRLLKRFSEQMVMLAKTSVDKNVKMTSSQFNSLTTNFKQVEDHILEIASRMNMFQVHLNKLTEAFNKRFLEDKAKDHAFNKLYESMQDYKEDFLSNAKKPVFLDLIRLYDDIQKMIGKEKKKNLELICDVIIEILYRNDIEVITEAPEIFDRTFQKAVKRIDVAEKSQDRKVAEILKVGFTKGTQIIRPQEVSVYIYKQKD